MYLDKQHPKPVYLQLKELLQNQIEQGVYLCHQQLPSERYLCQHHSLSRMTVRRALQALIAEGFAYTQAGKGTFVNQKSILNGQAQFNGSGPAKKTALQTVQLAGNCKQKLTSCLLSFDSAGTERAIQEALALHSLESVAGDLFFNTICTFEQMWHKGDVNLLTHNYAITTLRSHLIAMMNAAVVPCTDSKIVLACAPGDHHEMGLLLLALSLRRRGYQVVYLGQNLYAGEFDQIIDTVQPKLVCISAATAQAVETLAQVGFQYQNKLALEKEISGFVGQSKPQLVFGGVAFTRNPQAIPEVPGYYLGDTVRDAVVSVQKLLT